MGRHALCESGVNTASLYLKGEELEGLNVWLASPEVLERWRLISLSTAKGPSTYKSPEYIDLIGTSSHSGPFTNHGTCSRVNAEKIELAHPIDFTMVGS